ncbi:chemotaxis protein CheW [Agrobacterium tumefaciens]|uniref:Purine-binding chemotaxis protein CheW n=1 Tax=Agrobacterium tumefaciens TaxID=358 RepID=A0AA44F4V5_AGRTU|nr:chemotaxis protein CheW [Agrobacterium tumefaciens]NTB87577.1 purine-binding chemotaxis protein CheW [Agrobacterium tumefaciens]NTC19728.1 purine-binding chemotaxis protein CheW [Agrobacterium tumefaciens]NTC29656.1 purine-binding chemotaxis protein CheW [Agrobacterium tumefaciens]
MSGPGHTIIGTDPMLEIIAFRLHDQEFCVRTTTIREIRGWGPATPIPHSPADMIGVMNLRGSVIPIIDLANKVGMRSTEPTPRSAIVVAEVHGMAMGLIVDRVSDILTIPESLLQPVPDIGASGATNFSDGIIAQPDGMICFLNLERMFERAETMQMAAA